MYMKQKIVISSLAVLSLLTIFFWINKTQNGVPMAAQQAALSKVDTSFTDRERRTIMVGTIPLEVEVVTSPESTTQGLSGREEIGADGMLFIFPELRTPRFWMPDMKFDIDIVWLNDDTVVDISASVPKPKPEQKALPTYSPSEPVNRVLELPAGKAAELGIVPGTICNY